MKSDEYFIGVCLKLAEKGLGYTAPNPIVGSVLVYDGEIIGQGYHQKYGEAHAEVNCINSVKDTNRHLISKSTLYVSLEPCNHFGKTPPCTNFILEHKIPKVVIGCQDPFDKVQGSGVSMLRENGVEVVDSVLEAECQYTNRRFFTFHTKKRPYIILKWAQSNEGFIASNMEEQIWLTGEISKILVHRWRSEEASILVGYNTAKIDNPKLTNRSGEGLNPMRIVIDRYLSLTGDCSLINDNLPTIIFNEVKDDLKGEKHYKKIDFSISIPKQILNLLYQINLQSVIIEGGAKTLNLFIDEKLWDEARVFETQKEIGQGIKVNELVKPFARKELVGNDTLKIYYNN